MIKLVRRPGLALPSRPPCEQGESRRPADRSGIIRVQFHTVTGELIQCWRSDLLIHVAYAIVAHIVRKNKNYVRLRNWVVPFVGCPFSTKPVRLRSMVAPSAGCHFSTGSMA